MTDTSVEITNETTESTETPRGSSVEHDNLRVKPEVQYPQVVAIRLTTADHKTLNFAAKVAKLTKAEVIRRAVHGIEIKERISVFDAEAMSELSAIGNNLNQLAKQLNARVARDGMTPADLEVVRTEVLNLKKSFADLLPKLKTGGTT